MLFLQYVLLISLDDHIKIFASIIFIQKFQTSISI